jgi:hypothetical protein
VIYVKLPRDGVSAALFGIRSFTIKTTTTTMNLVQQFPDISAKIRSKNSMNGKKKHGTANVKQSLGYIEDKTVAQYYEGEFRRWHIKFLFIVAATLGICYLIVLKSSWVYNLIDIR